MEQDTGLFEQTSENMKLTDGGKNANKDLGGAINMASGRCQQNKPKYIKNN